MCRSIPSLASVSGACYRCQCTSFFVWSCSFRLFLLHDCSSRFIAHFYTLTAYYPITWPHVVWRFISNVFFSPFPECSSSTYSQVYFTLLDTRSGRRAVCFPTRIRVLKKVLRMLSIIGALLQLRFPWLWRKSVLPFVDAYVRIELHLVPMQQSKN